MIRAWIKVSGKEIGILVFSSNEDMSFAIYADNNGDISEMPLLTNTNEPRLTIFSPENRIAKE